MVFLLVAAKSVFFDDSRVILEDIKHSNEEDRYYCIGKTINGILTVRFTYRENKICIIGAGNCRKQRRIYEKRD